VADPAVGLGVEEFASALAVGQVGTVVGKLIVGFFVDLRGASAAFAESLLLMAGIMVAGVLCMQASWYWLSLALFVTYKVAKVS
jgi:predicted MFS family arabinose efflux permease